MLKTLFTLLLNILPDSVCRNGTAIAVLPFLFGVLILGSVGATFYALLGTGGLIFVPIFFAFFSGGDPVEVTDDMMHGKR